MTLINLSSKQNRFSFVALAETVRNAMAAARVLPHLFRAEPPSWTGLSAHLLADIGETPMSAQADALRDAFHVPLGSLGMWPRTGAGRHSVCPTRPLD